MKRFFKIFGITLGSLLGLAIITILVLIWLVFTPARLTPFARNQMDKLLTCESSLEKADLTFFSTFPDFSIHIKNLCLKNPMEGSPSDTLAFVEDLHATVDLRAFLKDDAVILKRFLLKNSFANLYTDSIGRSNLAIVPPGDEPEDTSSALKENPFSIIDVEKIKIDNLKIFYTDGKSGMAAGAMDMDAIIKLHLEDDDIGGDVDVSVGKLLFSLDGDNPISAEVRDAKMVIGGGMLDSLLSGELTVSLPKTSFNMGADKYLTSSSLSLEIPFEADVKKGDVHFSDAALTLDEFLMMIAGGLQIRDDGTIGMNVSLTTAEWELGKLLAKVPDPFSDLVEGIEGQGIISIAANADGVYGENSLPLITATLRLDDGKLRHISLPYTFTDVGADIFANLDLNEGGKSSAGINGIMAKTGSSSVMVSGNVSDLLGTMKCNLSLDADIHLPDVAPMLPDSMNVSIEGVSNAKVTAVFSMDQLQKMDVGNMDVTGDIVVSGLDMQYEDSISVKSPLMEIGVRTAAAKRKGVEVQALADRKASPFKDVVRARINAEELNAVVGKSISADIKDARFWLGVGDFMDTSSIMALACDFKIGDIFGAVDTVILDVTNPFGSFIMLPSAADKKKPSISCAYDSESMYVALDSEMSLDTREISIKASATDTGAPSDSSAAVGTGGLLARWNPRLSVDFNEGVIRKEGLELDIDIPNINFDYSSNRFAINESRIIMDESDFNLSGVVTKIEEYLNDTGLLTADLKFVSENTNLLQIMDVISGFGSSEGETPSAAPSVGEAEGEADPFMVPLGVDFTLDTKIKNADIGRGDIQNVKGTLYVKDGVVILEEMGFTSKAARMQLTAMYKSPRKDHLFAGLDFHLLDVDISELIYLIPQIDTIVPMLKSFDGEAQFHIAAETNLWGDYSLKMSTLRGAAAIEAKDLVLMDSETFSKISDMLLFSKKAENKVDSLSVEMTVFRNEVDLYPFLFSMDRYQAVIAGRHNLDMSFDYHISVIDCPLPVRLGLEVKGTFDDLKFKLVPCKYNNLFKPEKQKAREQQTLELKKIISDSLKANVKPQEKRADD